MIIQISYILWKRHQDQLLKDQGHSPNDGQPDSDILDFPIQDPEATLPATPSGESPPLRRSSRIRRPLNRLTL